MIKITVCVPVWKRKEMRIAFLDHMEAHIREARFFGVELSVSVSGSEGSETRSEAEERGFAYVEVPNDPLGFKFNAAIRNAEQCYKPDAFMILGSDTFFLPTLWGEYVRMIDKGHTYIGIKDLYLWDWQDNHAAYWPGYIGRRAGESIGPGRVILRERMVEYLGRWGGIYRDDINRSLDASATKRIGAADLIEGKSHLFVSCKAELSITPMASMPKDQLQYAEYTIFEELLAL